MSFGKRGLEQQAGISTQQHYQAEKSERADTPFSGFKFKLNKTQWMLLSILALLATILMIQKQEPQATESSTVAAKISDPDAPCREQGARAFVLAKEFVSSRLKSPATANFPWLDTGVYLGKCQYQVASYVDAQNSFGATIRSHYVAKLKVDPQTNNWSVVDFKMD